MSGLNSWAFRSDFQLILKITYFVSLLFMDEDTKALEKGACLRCWGWWSISSTGFKNPDSSTPSLLPWPPPSVRCWYHEFLWFRCFSVDWHIQLLGDIFPGWHQGDLKDNLHTLELQPLFFVMCFLILLMIFYPQLKPSGSSSTHPSLPPDCPWFYCLHLPRHSSCPVWIMETASLVHSCIYLYASLFQRKAMGLRKKHFLPPRVLNQRKKVEVRWTCHYWSARMTGWCFNINLKS